MLSTTLSTVRGRLRPALLSVALVLFVAACSGSGDPSVAATVAGEDIPIAEVEEQFETLAENPQVATQLETDESGEVERTLQAQALTNLVRTQLLDVGAAELGVEVTDEDIAEERASVIEQVGGEDALEQTLEQNNINDEEFEDLLRQNALQSAITSALPSEVTDADVQDAFETDEQGRFGEQVEARHILVETEEQAQEAIDRIEGGEDFADVAGELSQDTGSAESGGDLGAIARGQTVEPFEEAVFGAEVGELVGPVETQFGYHVIEVTDRLAAPELSDVESELRTELEQTQQAEAFNDFITELAADVEVDVNPRFGEWDAEQLQVVASDPLGTPAPDGEIPLTPSATEASE